MHALLRHRNGLLPFVQLLVHLHRLLDEPLLQQLLLRARQLAHEHRELALHGVVCEA